MKRGETVLLYDNHNNVINGAVEADDRSMEVYDAMQADAVDIASLGTGERNQSMPILQWNENLESMFGAESKKVKALWDRGGCNLPWESLRQLGDASIKSQRLYFSQGNVPNCMGCADAFAGHSAILSRMAMGDNRIYTSFNPMVTWAITKGGSTRGGQTVSEQAKGANEYGHFPESLVGSYKQKMPVNWRNYIEDALDYQWSLAFLPGRNVADLADQIIAVCKGGFAVAFANSTAVNGATTDSNGVKIARIAGSWAHATSFTSYRVVNGTEYIFWVNSHGPIYGSSEEGEPADGCWMTRSQVETMCKTSFHYGAPYAVIPESVWNADSRLITDIEVKRPVNFKFTIQ